ncbi:hypothetical protein JWG45_19490 [Leptospira sp. 201903070]|uniref:Lipoprotein n=1 Tax=Leptospira ainlahdjerensis TaxID=2810033 RepID=A0ABS2UG45_9LEPT|nr:hypothetical protein [Leptospira ainlahdjerensis]MBM9579331.1 hypothetical protein [Leptospira ainlahdjerensis]
MNKKMIQLAAVMMLAIAITACKPKEDDDTTTIAALAFFVDQTSGNCAQVLKVNATTYIATLSAVPKGGCNQATLIGSDLASYKVIQTANSDAVSALSASLNCSAATNNAIANSKNNILATTQATFDALVAGFKPFPISDLRVEALGVLSATNSQLTLLGFSPAEILALKVLTLEQTKLASATQSLGLLAAGAGDVACVTAITNNNKTAFAGFLGLDSTATTKATITGISSAICPYGSAAPAATKCTTLNTEF